LLHIVWEFHPNPEHTADFERVYGSAGDWAALFGKSPHYRQTILTRDLEVPGRYVLTDIWENRASFDDFKKNFQEEYDRLDRECETLTLKEIRIGEFEVL
jgi:heme-degrading monooxygenase HmoA